MTTICDARDSKPPVICLMGPTASGKTAAALPLTSLFNAEIVSVDSALVYQQMDIGTAKPTQEILERYPHALIDLLPPWESYSVADFVSDAVTIILALHSRGKIPLLVGGTMMYYHALQQGLASLPTCDIQVREQLQQRVEKEGLTAIHNELKHVDPVAAARIHPNDPQRTLRALEVYLHTGQPLSELQQQTSPSTQFDFINLALLPTDRQVLHARIAHRFDEMLAQGFIDEVQALHLNPKMQVDCPAMRSVGYRQVWQYLDNEFDKVSLRDNAITATRQLAKRQITWLRSWENCTTIDLQGPDCVRALYEHLRRLGF